MGFLVFSFSTFCLFINVHDKRFKVKHQGYILLDT